MAHLPSSLTSLLHVTPADLASHRPVDPNRAAHEAEVLERAPAIIAAYEHGTTLDGFEVRKAAAEWWRHELLSILRG